MKTQNKYQDVEIIELEKSIIKKAEKKFKNQINELHSINTKIFNMQEDDPKTKTKDKLEDEKKEIDTILNRINEIKEQIDIFKNNKLIDDTIYIDDKSLMEDILKYKKIIEKEINLKEQYEKTKEYKKVIKEINITKENCINLKEEIEKQLDISKRQEEKLELDENAIKTEEILSERINELIEEEIELINNYNKKIGIIEEESKIIYNYDKLKRVLSLEIKYLALMNLMPLKGTIPYIAVAAKQTKDTIDLLSSGPLITSEEKINYYVKDYTKELEEAEYSINDIDQMLNNSLYIINSFKQKIIENDLMNKDERYAELLLKIDKLNNCIMDYNEKLAISRSKISQNKNKNIEMKEKVLKLNKKT